MAKGKKTGGRRKGTPNRFSVALKDMILQALSDAGGSAYLTRQAERNPAAFLALIGRVLPLQVKDGSDEPQVPQTMKHIYDIKAPWRPEDDPAFKAG